MTADELREAVARAKPIERRVVRYICPFCKRGRSDRSAAWAHVARCFRNPAARSCKTCAAYQPVERSDYNTGYPGCSEGCHAGNDISARLPVGCDDWEPSQGSAMLSQLRKELSNG